MRVVASKALSTRARDGDVAGICASRSVSVGVKQSGSKDSLKLTSIYQDIAQYALRG